MESPRAESTKPVRCSDIFLSELTLSGLNSFFCPFQFESVLQQLESSIAEAIDLRLQQITPSIVDAAACLVRIAFADFTPSCKEKVYNLILNKINRYLLSPFTQEFEKSCQPFEYATQSFYPSNESRAIIRGYLKLLLNSYSSMDEPSFHELTINCSPDNSFCQDLANSISTHLSAIYQRDLNLSVAGQVKLHPPRLHDTGSVSWHYDGDPFFIKVLVYLADQPLGADGSFEILTPLRNTPATMNLHTKTVIQSIYHGEVLDIIGSGYHKTGPFLLSSHLPREQLSSAFASYYKHVSFPPSQFSYIIFKGCEVLHRGGSNVRSFRPVFQGLISSKLG